MVTEAEGVLKPSRTTEECICESSAGTKVRNNDITLFHSEIDKDSGNCHCQIGKVMFVKGYMKNKSAVTSPNSLFASTEYTEDGQIKMDYLSDEKQTLLVFNSHKWANPLDYFTDKNAERLANGKWITVDDIFDEKISGEIVDAFNEALMLVLDHLDELDTKLILLGDYIHGGNDNYGVLDKIMSLQNKYGQDKVIALMGNHEEFVLFGDSTINSMWSLSGVRDEDYRDGMDDDEKYVQWMENLPRYYVEGNTIFVHAGIDEDAGELWEFNTDEETFVGKYPPETGKIEGLDMKVVAGHVSTAEISCDPTFHEIYYDGESHYFIDGTVLDTGVIPVLMVDTETDKYYRVTEGGSWLIQPYEE